MRLLISDGTWGLLLGHTDSIDVLTKLSCGCGMDDMTLVIAKTFLQNTSNILKEQPAEAAHHGGGPDGVISYLDHEVPHQVQSTRSLNKLSINGSKVSMPQHYEFGDKHSDRLRNNIDSDEISAIVRQLHDRTRSTSDRHGQF